MSHFWIAKGIWLWVAVVGVLVASILLIAVLLHLPPRFRRPLMSAIVFISGLFYAVEFFWPTHPVTKPNGTVAQENFLTPYIPAVIAPLAQILAALILGLGLLSLLRIHGANVLRRRPGWVNSLALLLSAVVMMVVGLWSTASTGEHPVVDQIYNHLFQGVYQNMDAAMFSMIAFFILSAAYRAFRIRSIEASILMASALIVLMGLSFGVLVTSFVPAEGFAVNFRMETWSNWVLSVLSLPALRAIDFGVGLGMLATGLRIWLGIERGALFAD
jgi:hypothetical protein